MQPITMITLSREYGAGAGDLALNLGARLGWRVLDRDLAPSVAERLGAPAAALVPFDERAPSLMERVSKAFIIGSPAWLVNPDVMQQPEAEDVARATETLLVEAAAQSPVVIVEHGAQAIFRGRPGALHVRLVAPIDVRVRRICERRTCDQREATASARRLDADRAHYLRQFYDLDVHDPMLYDLQINTGRVALEEVADLLVRLVESRRGATAPPA